MTSRRARRSTVGRAGRIATRVRRASIGRRRTRATSSKSIPTASCRSSPPKSRTGPPPAACAGQLGDWDMDSSLVYGKNEMEFTIENTLNRSLGPASKTVFDAGGFDYDQLVLNVSGVREVEVGAFASPLNVAVGVEARRESYSIFAGEPDSYRNGGVLLNGQPTRVRRAGLPGLSSVERSGRRPHGRRRLRRSRSERDGEVPRVGRPARRELLGLRREPLRQARRRATTSPTAFALRGSIQNGFRAPSLPQQFFATTSTNFIDGVPFDITTFPVSDPVAIALGAQDARRGRVRQLLARRGAAAWRCRASRSTPTASTSTIASCCPRT